MKDRVEAPELEKPHWRLDGECEQGDTSALIGRLRDACRGAHETVRLAGYRLSLATVALQLLAGGATSFGLFATTGALDELLAMARAGGAFTATLPELATVLAAYTVRGALESGVAWNQARLVPQVRRVAEERLFEAALRVELAAFEDPSFYDRLHRARGRALLHLERATENAVELIGSSLAVVAATATAALLSPLLLPLLVLSLVPHSWATVRSARLEYTTMARTIALRRRVGMVADLMTRRESAPEIRANQAEKFLLKQYREAADGLRDREVGVGVAQVRVRTAGRALAGVGIGLTYAALILLLQAGSVPLAVAGTAVIAIRAATAALTRLVVATNELFEQTLYISDYEKFLADAEAHVWRTGGLVAPPAPTQISLRDVSFRYPGAQDGGQALRSVTLTIPAGASVALVGENGSGKSTLAKVIAGLYRPTGGRIMWDGVDIRDFDPVSYHERIMIVQQEPVRWPNTARENVRVGRHDRFDPDDGALYEAAAKADASEVIDQLPHGWDTLLSKYFRGGRELSGGQWQRIAVARGLYRDAPVLIWDEPTAALDAKAEHSIYQALAGMARGRTVILITHRLASVRHADFIYFLHEGAIAEQGTHESLMAAGGRYAELYELQMRLYGAVAEKVPAAS